MATGARTTVADVRHAFVRAVITRIGTVIGLNVEAQRDCFLHLRYYETCRKRIRDMGVAAVAVQRVTGAARLRGVWLHRAPAIPMTETLRRDVAGLYEWARAGYTPHQYPGRVALFWARDELVGAYSDPTMGWRKVAKQVELHVVPGAHLSCITTYASDLGTQLSTYLSEESTT